MEDTEVAEVVSIAVDMQVVGSLLLVKRYGDDPADAVAAVTPPENEAVAAAAATPPENEAVAIFNSLLLNDEQIDSKFCLSCGVRFSDCNEAAAKTAEATVLEMLLKIEVDAVDKVVAAVSVGLDPVDASNCFFASIVNLTF